MVGTAAAGCSVYDEDLASPSDASRERNSAEPSNDGPDWPAETGGADGHLHDGGNVPEDAATDASVGATEDGRDAGGDGADSGPTDASVDATEEQGQADSVGPPDVEIADADAGPDTTGGADATSDTAAPSDASFDAGILRDADGGGAPDAADAGPTGSGLIDDMEDNDNFILAREGRQGVWFTVNDGTPGAIQTPPTPFTMSSIPAGRGSSLYAARSSGYGFASWRPLMGFWFQQPPTGPKQPYDISRYRGITFVARFASSDAATVSPSVRVVIPDRNTDPEGMVCTGGGCSDHFGVNITLTAQWTSYTVLFATMTQEGWGTHAAQFDAPNAYGVEFEFAIQSTFDCWIDDIALVP